MVGGWRPEVGSNGRLGAVLVGLPDGERGLAVRRPRRLRPGRAPPARRSPCGCARCRRDTSPFADEVPAIDAQGTTWVEPRVVVEVRTLELTGQHRLRQPAYLGVRSDLSPADLEEVDDA